jgi:L-lactate dehydrogenase complex protein LldG
MSSRAEILARIANNKPQKIVAPDINILENTHLTPSESLDRFCTVATGIGAKIISINSLSEVKTYIENQIGENQRVITSIPELLGIAEDGALLIESIPHDLKNVDFAVIRAEFGVAENGALWVTAAQMVIRVLPFITQHLAIIINATDIVSNMHAAYSRTAGSDHDFAAFIAGPSKTADIEQSLVLGAHGSRSLVVFIINN